MISITEHLKWPCTCAVWLKPINGELWELQLGRLIILYKENYLKVMHFKRFITLIMPT